MIFFEKMDRVFGCDDLMRNILTFINKGELLPLKITNGKFKNIINTNESLIVYFTGSIEMIKFAIENGCDIRKLINATAENGNLEGLKWLKSQGYEFHILDLKYAAKNGHIHILEYLKSIMNESSCDIVILLGAASGGQIETIKWIKSHNTSHMYYSWAFCEAARCGQLETLKWMKENNLPIRVSNEFLLRGCKDAIEIQGVNPKKIAELIRNKKGFIGATGKVDFVNIDPGPGSDE